MVNAPLLNGYVAPPPKRKKKKERRRGEDIHIHNLEKSWLPHHVLHEKHRELVALPRTIKLYQAAES